MTVVPLVVSLLITGIASVADTAKTGGLVLRAIILFTLLHLLRRHLSTSCRPTACSRSGRSIAPLLRPSSPALAIEAVTIVEPPTFASWLQGLAPYNPVKAAAEDGMLALVVFSIFFGFATTRLAAPMREQIVNFFRAVSEAMIVIVHWVLLAGPIGVFALALGVGLHAGFAAAGTLAQYVVIVTAVTAGITVIAWLIAVTWGGQPIGRFTTAATPGVGDRGVDAIVARVAAGHARSGAARSAHSAERRRRGVAAGCGDLPFHQPGREPGGLSIFVAHLYSIEPTLASDR